MFMGMPPSKDLMELFLKYHSKASDKTNVVAKLSLLKAMKRVTKAQIQNLSTMIPDLFKNFGKIIDKMVKHD